QANPTKKRKKARTAPAMRAFFFGGTQAHEFASLSRTEFGRLLEARIRAIAIFPIFAAQLLGAAFDFEPLVVDHGADAIFERAFDLLGLAFGAFGRLRGFLLGLA